MTSAQGLSAEAPRRRVLVLAALAGVAATLVVASAPLAAALLVAIALGAIASHGLRPALFALILLAPWSTLGNVVVGGRLAALGVDAGFVFVTLAVVVAAWPIGPRGRLEWAIAVGAICLAALGMVEMFNPRGLRLLLGLEGYRAFFFPLIALPLGYVLSVRSQRFAESLLLALGLTAVAVALMGIRQVFLPLPIDYAIIKNAQSSAQVFFVTGTDRVRAFSPLPGPFHFGLLMTIGLAAVGAPTLRELDGRRLAALGLLSLALLFNATRLNWLGAFASAVTLLLVSLQRRRLRRWLIRLASGTLVLVAVLAAVWFLDVFAPIKQFGLDLLANPLANSSFVYRVLGWKYSVFPAIAAAPVLGYGTGTAKDGIGLFWSHNVLLKILLEGGAVALVFYLATTAAIFIALVKRRGEDLARVGLALIVGVHAAGMFGPILDTYPANVFYWLILGAGLGLSGRSSAPSSMTLQDGHI